MKGSTNERHNQIHIRWYSSNDLVLAKHYRSNYQWCAEHYRYSGHYTCTLLASNSNRMVDSTMTKRKTIKITMDSVVVFRLELQGSEEIIKDIVEDYSFKRALTNATEELIKMKVQKSTVQTVNKMTVKK